LHQKRDGSPRDGIRIGDAWKGPRKKKGYVFSGLGEEERCIVSSHGSGDYLEKVVTGRVESREGKSGVHLAEKEEMTKHRAEKRQRRPGRFSAAIQFKIWRVTMEKTKQIPGNGCRETVRLLRKRLAQDPRGRGTKASHIQKNRKKTTLDEPRGKVESFFCFRGGTKSWKRKKKGERSKSCFETYEGPSRGSLPLPGPFQVTRFLAREKKTR